MENTKEKILAAALELFAENGYEAVSVSMIAEKVGISKGALYRHYQSKKDLFNSILARMENQDSNNAESYDMPEATLTEAPEKYQQVSLSEIVEYSKSQFRYWVEDKFASNFRKMLTLEQYRNIEMSKLYQQYLASGPLGYMIDLFESIGISNAKENATEFYGVMFLFYSYYDGAENKSETTAQLDASLDRMKIRLEENLNHKKEKKYVNYNSQ